MELKSRFDYLSLMFPLCMSFCVFSKMYDIRWWQKLWDIQEILVTFVDLNIRIPTNK